MRSYYDDRRGEPPVRGVNAGVELAGTHDDDPTGRTTKATADVFAAYIPKSLPTVQFDAATYVGLNHDTPDVEVLDRRVEAFLGSLPSRRRSAILT